MEQRIVSLNDDDYDDLTGVLDALMGTGVAQLRQMAGVRVMDLFGWFDVAWPDLFKG